MRSAVEADLALVGGVEGAQQVQQRALAGAALADDGQEFAAADAQAHPLQHRDFEQVPLR